MARTWGLLLILAALAGCAATARPPADATRAALGDDDARIERARRLADALAQASSAPQRLHVALSSRSEPGAWSWPDGRIRVSRALVDLLDDDELAAALAHEIGHLVDARRDAAAAAGSAAALDGRHDGAGSEARADRIACTLLGASGTVPAALPRMLRKVAAVAPVDGDGPDPSALRARAQAAEAVCATTR